MRECLFCERPLSPDPKDPYCGPRCRQHHWAFLLLCHFWIRRDPAVEQLAWDFFAWSGDGPASA